MWQDRRLRAHWGESFHEPFHQDGVFVLPKAREIAAARMALATVRGPRMLRG